MEEEDKDTVSASTVTEEKVGTKGRQRVVSRHSRLVMDKTGHERRNKFQKDTVRRKTVRLFLTRRSLRMFNVTVVIHGQG